MATKKSRIILVLILALAGFLRLYRLGNYPPLNADEAAIGYNAWSLLKTGRDEHGDFWPIHFKSFGDYKPGAYFYMVLPFVKLFGLNQWSVRLPSALMGMATVWLVFSLSKLLWKDNRLGLIWAFVLSISPWHIHFSRGGWESNVALFLIVLGTYFFFKAIKNRKRISFWLTLSAFHFVVAMYTYHSARLVAPALVLGLVAFNFNLIKQEAKKLILPVIIGFLLVIPLATSFLSGGASARFSGVGLFADSGPLWRVNELINHYQGETVFWFRIFHNKPVIYTISLLRKYLSHFDGRFLFIDGDQVPRSKLPDMAVMHLIEFLPLLLGAYFWIKQKTKYQYLPLLWLFVAPLASAMTFQAPSALRALSMTIPLTFFTAYGINVLTRKRFSQPLKFTCYCLLVTCYLFSFFYWKDRYFTHYLKRFPTAWPDFKPVAGWLKENSQDYQKICIGGKYDQPYILALFYLQYPPEKIQKEIKLTEPDQFGFSTVEKFGKYYFGNCQDFDGKILVK